MSTKNIYPDHIGW